MEERTGVDLDQVIPYDTLEPGDRFRHEDGSTFRTGVWQVLSQKDTFGDHYAQSESNGDKYAPIHDAKVIAVSHEEADRERQAASLKVINFIPGDRVRIKPSVTNCSWGMTTEMEQARDEGEVLTVDECRTVGQRKKIKVRGSRFRNVAIEPGSLELVQDESTIHLALTPCQAVTLLAITRRCSGAPRTSRRGDMDRIGHALTAAGVDDVKAFKLSSDQVTGEISFNTDPERKPTTYPWDKARCLYSDIGPGERFRLSQRETGDRVKLIEADSDGDVYSLRADGNQSVNGFPGETWVYRSSILREHGIA